MDFLGNENKFLLWSVLQESDVFQNIPNNRFDDIRATFDKVLNNYNQKCDSSSSSIKQDMVSMNKEVIPILLNKFNAISNSQLSMSNGASQKNLEVVYRAEDNDRIEDIHKRRAEDFNNKIQEQQTNMNELLQPKKPKEVSFADTNDDKPLGGDMDRLIQDMLTSRERELETIVATQSEIYDAKKWIGTSETTEKERPIIEKPIIEKPIIEKPIIEKPIIDNENITSSIIMPYNNDNDIMSKFKKKDPYKEVMDEIKALKRNQDKMMTLLEKVSFMLEKPSPEEL